jgi:hypothetical protein
MSRTRTRGKRGVDVSEPTKAMVIGESYLSYARDMMQGYGTDGHGDYDIVTDVDPRIADAADRLDDAIAGAETDDEWVTAARIRTALHETYVPRATLDDASARQQDIARMSMHVAYSMFLQSRLAREVRNGKPSAPWM